MFIRLHISRQWFHAHNYCPVLTGAGEYHCDSSDGLLSVRLVRRQAFPISYFEIFADDRIVFGYGDNSVTSAKEYLRLELTNTALSVQRDEHCTLPLYYMEDETGLWLSNEYDFIVRRLPVAAPDIAYITGVLSGDNSYDDATFLREVRRLNERETLTYTTKGMQVAMPEQRSWLATAELPSSDPRDFRKMIESHFENFYAGYLQNQSYAFQASGGIDSSTLPLFLSRRISERPYLASVMLPGVAGDTQKLKLAALAHYCGLSVLQTGWERQTDFPLAELFYTGHYPFVTSDAVTYTTSLRRHIAQLQAVGVSILVTGIGGDDILENIPCPATYYGYGPESRQARRHKTLAPFLTNKFREQFIAAVPDIPKRPVPLLPTSILGHTDVNNLYIEAGIWPVSPFLDTGFYEFCQGLPAHLRENKNIMRMYYQARQYPAILYERAKSESLGPFLNGFILSPLFRDLAEQFVREGICQRAGLISYDVFQEELQQARLTGNARWLFTMFELVSTEISLRATPNLQFGV